MAAATCELTLLPEHQTCTVPAGTTLREALARLDVPLTAPCSGEGTCGKCKVEVHQGAVEDPQGTERALLEVEQLHAGLRLACQARLLGDAQVSVPAYSREPTMRIIMGGTGTQVAVDPLLSKRAVHLTTQTLAEPYARLEHLRRCGDFRADLRADWDLLPQLPALLPVEESTITAVVRDDQLLAIEAGDTADRCYGLSLDLGSTTVVACLVDLNTGLDLAYGATVNRQTEHGHDVIARIDLCAEREDGLKLLRRAALDSLEEAIEQVLVEANVQREEIYEATLVGNATMAHLFLGIPPASLGTMPYVSTVGDPVEAPARDLGLRLHPAARIHVLPNIAGFVGSDSVGAILAAGLDEDDGRIRLLADIGTNCELILRLGGRLFVTSTPAGPAFEGASITCGMYAAPGAIEQVTLDDDVHCKVIGAKAAQGLCGSGLVNAVSELVRTGIVDDTGRLLPVAELNGEIGPALRDRIIEREDEIAFVLAEGETPVSLSQRDIRELQLAKAAIRTGIDVLLEYAGVEPDQLDEFCVAGGFGSYIDKAGAMLLGLFPRMAPTKIHFIGNGALVGANMVLLARQLRHRSVRVARQAEHLQLAHTPNFQMRFTEAMLFT